MYRFNLHGRKYRDENNDDGAGGGNSSGNDGNDNNNNDNLQSHDSLWDAGGNDGNNGNDDSSNNGNSGNDQIPDANEAFNKHIETLDFTAGINLQEGMQAIQNGDLEAFANLLQQVGINAYRNSLVDANKVVQQRVDQMAQTVKDDVSSSNATSAVVSAMQEKLPFTKQKAFEPIAKLVLTQFLEKKFSPEDAITETGKYFQNLSGETQKLSPKPPGSRPSGNFRGSSDNQDGNSDAGEPDWVDMLGGPAV